MSQPRQDRRATGLGPRPLNVNALFWPSCRFSWQYLTSAHQAGGAAMYSTPSMCAVCCVVTCYTVYAHVYVRTVPSWRRMAARVADAAQMLCWQRLSKSPDDEVCVLLCEDFVIPLPGTVSRTSTQHAVVQRGSMIVQRRSCKLVTMAWS